MTLAPVGLAGYGPRLTTVAHLLDRSGLGGRLWQPDAAPDQADASGAETVERVPLEQLRETSLVVCVAPIHEMRPFARRLGDVLSGRHALVHLGRTLDHRALEPISSILEEETPTRRFGFVTGPMVPDDVLEGRSASALCASAFPEVLDLVDEALSSERFHVYASDDLVGAEVAAAYTRILAVLDGLAAAEQYGRSMRSTLFARGLAEAGRFVEAAGGEAETTFGLAGAGNLRADTTGEGNVDCRIGREWGRRGGDLDELRDDLSPSQLELFDLLEALLDDAPIELLDLSLLEIVGRGMIGTKGLDWTLERLERLPSRRP
jgi:hypothetical protein